MYEVKSDKVAMMEAKQDGLENMPAPKKELSVRAKKPKPGERVSKGDGSVVLVCPYPPRNHLCL
jgi:nuclear pore complex protein Nup133